MNHFSFSLLGLLAVALFFFSGCDPETAAAQGKPTPAPTPAPPKCQQDTNAKEIAARLLLSPDGHHYTHLVPDPVGPAMQLISDGVIARDRFADAGPVVFHPKNDRFAFIGVYRGATFILEYNNGALYPNVAHPIQAAPANKWVCYSANGKLVTLAKNNGRWLLLVRDDAPQSKFQEIPLAGQPSRLELLPPNKGKEGFRYEIELDGMTQEIRIWFKTDH